MEKIPEMPVTAKAEFKKLANVMEKLYTQKGLLLVRENGNWIVRHRNGQEWKL